MNVKFGLKIALLPAILTVLISFGCCEPTVEPECEFQGVKAALFCDQGDYTFTNSAGTTLRFWTLTEHRWLNAVNQDTLPSQEEQNDLVSSFNNLFEMQLDYQSIAQLFPNYSGVLERGRPPVCPPTSSWENTGFDIVWDDANMEFIEAKITDIQGLPFVGQKTGNSVHFDISSNNPPSAGDAMVYVKMKNLTSGVSTIIVNTFVLQN